MIHNTERIYIDIHTYKHRGKYIYIYIHICIYICICMHGHRHRHRHIRTSLCRRRRLCLHVHVYVLCTCIGICICIYIYVSMYLYMYIYIYTHIFLHTYVHIHVYLCLSICIYEPLCHGIATLLQNGTLTDSNRTLWDSEPSTQPGRGASAVPTSGLGRIPWCPGYSGIGSQYPYLLEILGPDSLSMMYLCPLWLLLLGDSGGVFIALLLVPK